MNKMIKNKGFYFNYFLKHDIDLKYYLEFIGLFKNKFY